MAKFCSQCGAQINDDAAFCNSCGAKVNNAEKTEVENEAVEAVETAEVKTAAEAENDNEAVAVPDEDTPESNENTAVQETAAKDQSEENSTPLDKGIAFAKDKVGDKYEAFKTSPNRDKYIGFAAIGIVAIVVIAVVLSLVLGGGYKGAVKDYVKFCEGGDFDDYIDATPDIIYEAQVEGYCDGDEDKLEELKNYRGVAEEDKFYEESYNKITEKLNKKELFIEYGDEIDYEDLVDLAVKVYDLKSNESQAI